MGKIMTKQILMTGDAQYDTHCAAVMDILKEKGYPVLFISYAEIASELSLNYSISNNSDASIYFEKQGVSLDINDIGVIWNRKRRMGESLIYPKTGMYDRIFYHNETMAFKQKIISLISLKNIRWLNFPEYVDKADNKVYQLSLAKKVGFLIPDTFVGNNFDEVKKRVELYGKVLVKTIQYLCIHDDPRVHGMQYFLELMWKDYFNNDNYSDFIDKTVNLFKSNINEYDPDMIERHLFYPFMMDMQKLEEKKEIIERTGLIYQNYIQKKYELRIIVVKDKVFAFKVNNQEASDDNIKLDWRHCFSESNFNLVSWEVTELPITIEKKCVELVKELNLDYSAIDMILTPDDEYYFLEINPSGNYMWLEKATKVKISEEIAKYIIHLYNKKPD
jgi:glutathione synthase/RimK-type ligase-like ATP-grasp enzyme